MDDSCRERTRHESAVENGNARDFGNAPKSFKLKAIPKKLQANCLTTHCRIIRQTSNRVFVDKTGCPRSSVDGHEARSTRATHLYDCRARSFTRFAPGLTAPGKASLPLSPGTTRTTDPDYGPCRRDTPQVNGDR